MMALRHVLPIGTLLGAALAGCSVLNPSPAATETPTASLVPTAETDEADDSPALTDTLAPSSAPETPSPEPTRTPRPTDSADEAENDNSGGDEDVQRSNQSSHSTPDPRRGQGRGNGSRDSQSAEVVELDVCTLLTPEEAAEALDMEDEFEAESMTGGCSFTRTNANANTYVAASLTAFQADEARFTLSVLIATLSQYQNSDVEGDIEDLIDEVRDEIEDMSLQDIFEEILLPLYEDFGFDVDDADDQGADAAYWSWYGDSSAETGFGELIVLRDDAYPTLDIMGLEDRDSENAAGEMADIALDRLPERFSVLPDDYEDMLTP